MENFLVEDELAFITDFNKVFELLAERSTDAEEIKQMKEYFIEEYPEIFVDPFDFYAMETEAERIVNDEKKLGDIEEKLLRGRSDERFMNYEGMDDDEILTTVQKKNMYQRVIEDATRSKIYFASMQGRLLDIYFNQGKNVYQRMLNKTGIKRRWAGFLRKLCKFVIVCNQLLYCMVSSRYIHCNFKSIEVTCKRHLESWK